MWGMARILVIDDAPDLALVLRMQLERAGHEVITAENGRRGLRRFYEDRPDLVVLDLRMPELDGWETLERLRDLSEVPVLIAQRHDSPSAEQLARLRPERRRLTAASPPGARAHRARRRAAQSGTLRRSSSSHTVARASLGARQSPRGESEPPEPTLGAFGIAERLNWLVWKKRSRKTPSQCLISAREYALRRVGRDQVRPRAALDVAPGVLGQERDLARRGSRSAGCRTGRSPAARTGRPCSRCRRSACRPRPGPARARSRCRAPTAGPR